MYLKFQIHHLGFDAVVTAAKFGVGEMNGPDGFDRPAFDDPPLALLFGILTEEFDFVTDQCRGQHRIGIDPDLSIFTDAAHLHSDFVGMPNHHD